MSDVFTIGESMGRLSATRIGPLRHSPELQLGVAGAESNVAVGLTRLGTSTHWLGRVGDDEFGRLIRATLLGEGVATDAITDPDAPTGLLVKERRTADATRVMYYRERSAGSRLSVMDVEERADEIAAARVLHVTGITPALSDDARRAVLRAADIAREAGTMVSFDVNYRSTLWPRDEAAAVLAELAERATIVFAGVSEARLLVDAGSGAAAGARTDTAPSLPGVPADEAASLARELAARGATHAVVKLGADGAVAVIDGTTHVAPILRVHEVDPVGAGDAFTAGFLSEVLAESDPDRILDTAARCGAFAVTVDGDWEGLPSRDDLSLLGSADVHR